MTIRCSFLATWTVVAALGAATLGSGAAEAGDFAAFGFSRYLPHSVRSKIESYFDKAPVAKPKHDHAAGTNSAVVTESKTPVAAGGAMLPPLDPNRSSPGSAGGYLLPAGRDCLSKQILP